MEDLYLLIDSHEKVKKLSGWDKIKLKILNEPHYDELFEKWINNNMELKRKFKTKRSGLYDNYLNFCKKENNEYILKKKELYHKLNQKFQLVPSGRPYYYGFQLKSFL
jgi:hypothetical protein